MSGGWRTGQPPTELAPLIEELDQIDSRLRTLEAPTSEQTYQTVPKLQALVINIQAQLDAWVLTRWTNAQIQAAIASPGAISPTSVAASGAISTPGVGTFDGGIVSADVKARTLSVGYDAVYIDSSNRMGKSPSARRFKQDIEPEHFDVALLDELVPVHFRLKGAVEVLGDDAPVEVGFIAEELDEIGLGQYVTRDPDGTPHGIAYERLVVPLVAGYQSLARRLDALEGEWTRP